MEPGVPLDHCSSQHGQMFASRSRRRPPRRAVRLRLRLCKCLFSGNVSESSNQGDVWGINPGHWTQFFYDTFSHFQRHMWLKKGTWLFKPARERLGETSKWRSTQTAQGLSSPGRGPTLPFNKLPGDTGAAGAATTPKSKAVTPPSWLSA